MPRLPPLTALRAFEAAARHMSFAKAADELHVTPAALSYQIKSLEQHLGQPVFRRLNRAVELTEAGHALMPGIARGFHSFHDAVRAVARLAADRPLGVTAGPGFTAKWLAPRLFGFASRHPQIELRFAASLRMLDFDRDGVDVAIRFGTIPADGVFSETLLTDWVIPLCTPEIAARLRTPADLARETLIHDDSLEAADIHVGWPEWLATQGVRGCNMVGPHFSGADHALDAAIAGAGVVLGRGVLAERDVTQGRLAVPFPVALRTGSCFHIVCPQGRETEPAVATFLDWLREETASLATWSEGFEMLAPPQ